MPAPDKIAMENVNSPGRVVRVDADKYHAMPAAMLAVLPDTAPGLIAPRPRPAWKLSAPVALRAPFAKSLNPITPLLPCKLNPKPHTPFGPNVILDLRNAGTADVVAYKLEFDG
jgi:hypothetical protein